eukprot:jgi/Tetstr1/457143/TSEL_043793.t1
MVVQILANLTSHSPRFTTELYKLWFILNTNDITIRARNINTTANIYADRLSREIDYDDLADPCNEATDNLRLPDGAWHNWCNLPWGLIDDLFIKLHTSGAAATVIVPYWPD